MQHETSSSESTSFRPRIGAVDIRSLSKSFGRFYALHRVSMTLHAGSVTAILGNNGAGKTTLLNILATLDAPSHGSVLYDSMSWKDFARTRRRHLGWVSHDMLLYEELTGRENLTFFARMYNIKDLAQRVDAWLRRIDLVDAADRRVSTYSRGMRQRLTIARALLHNPSIVLLDEPMTGLDQQGTRELIKLIDELRRAKKIVVFITHNLYQLENIADQIAILKNGELRFFAPTNTITSIHELYESHA